MGEKLGLQEQVEGMQGQLDDSLTEIHCLAHLGKKELDPADYENFLKGYAKLSAKELEICEALVSGLSTRQCAERAGCATSTVHTARGSMKRPASTRYASCSSVWHSCG